MDIARTRALRAAPLHTPTDLGEAAVKDIAAALTALLADTFALYLKTKNFHWHMSGPHFRDYHLLLDEQADQIFPSPTILPNGPARSAVAPCARSARSAACSASPTTMPSSSPRPTCWPNWPMTTHASSACCVPCTNSPPVTMIPPPPASSKSGSTKPNAGPGSCSRRVGPATKLGIGVARPPPMPQSQLDRCTGRRSGPHTDALR
jgi:hypothetical protein